MIVDNILSDYMTEVLKLTEDNTRISINELDYSCDVHSDKKLKCRSWICTVYGTTEIECIKRAKTIIKAFNLENKETLKQLKK